MSSLDLTARSQALLLAYYADRNNWGGTPLVGGNVGGSKADRGNLADLKKKGLITTTTDEGQIWLSFTELGMNVCEELTAPAQKKAKMTADEFEIAIQQDAKSAPSATKSYAHKQDAKRAAIKALGSPLASDHRDGGQGENGHQFRLTQGEDGRWTFVITVPLSTLQDTFANDTKVQDELAARRRAKAAKTATSPAKEKKSKSTPTMRERLEAIKVKKGVAIDKALIKSELGEMDDKKARKLARQLKAIRAARAAS